MPAANNTSDPHNRKSGRPFPPPQHELSDEAEFPPQHGAALGFGAQHAGSCVAGASIGVRFNSERRSALRSRSSSPAGGFEQQSDMNARQTRPRSTDCPTPASGEFLEKTSLPFTITG